jgi:hypothetical protein
MVRQGRCDSMGRRLMSEARDPILTAAIERAVRETALKLWKRGQTVTDIVAKLAAVTDMPDISTSREAGIAARAARRDEMLAAVMRYEQAGRRDAVTRAARDFAVDKTDETEIESNAKSIRRWRSKLSGQCPSSAPKIV